MRARELVDTAGPGMKKTSGQSSAPPSLVELDEVILTGAELQDMVTMLDRRSEQIVVRVKRSADSLTHETVTLRQLAPLLLRKQVFGAQIQYSYKSGRWLDTLVVTMEGVRLVRVQLG